MKKFAIAGLLALGLLACPQQKADAWIKVQFGVGLNFSFESANNSWFWGAFNNGQVPGYPTDVPVGHHYGHGYGSYGGYAGGGYDSGSYDHGHGQGNHNGSGEQQKQESNGKQNETQAYRYPSNYGVYQPVSYQPSYYYPQSNHYTQPSYYYPSYGYGYGYSSVPSYWYGY